MGSPERLMSIIDLSELLGVPVNTVYGWRQRGEDRWGIGLVVMFGIAELRLRSGLRASWRAAIRGTISHGLHRAAEADQDGRER